MGLCRGVFTIFALIFILLLEKHVASGQVFEYYQNTSNPYSVNVSCNTETMNIRLQSQPSMGLMYVEGNSTSPCSAGPSEQFNLTLYFGDNVCGMTSFTPTTQIVIFFQTISLDVRSQYDGRYLITCMGVFKGEVTVESQPVEVATRAPEEIIRGSILARPNDTAPPLIMRFTKNGAVVNTATVNELVGLKIEVIGDTRTMYSIKPKSCKATDNLRTANTALDLYANGCPAATYRDVLSLTTFSRPGSVDFEAASTFRAFTFVTQNNFTVLFQCTVLVCPANDTDCFLPSCTARRKRSIFSTLIREKRQTLINETARLERQYNTSVASLLYVEPLHYLNTLENPSPGTNDNVNIGLYPTIFIVVAAGLSVTGICFIIVVVYRRRKDQKKKETDSGMRFSEMKDDKDQANKKTEKKEPNGMPLGYNNEAYVPYGVEIVNIHRKFEELFAQRNE